MKLMAVVGLGITILLNSESHVYAASEEIKYDEMDQYLQKAVKETHIPGMSVLLVDKEKVLFSKTYGICDSSDESFIIGSNSKSFTAVAIMQLVEQGKVDLNDTIDRYLPGIHEGDKITVKQLLNHTSGISTYDTQEDFEVSSKQGTHVYANANYGLLGKIIESVTGITYCDYIRTNIFEPLQMTNTFTSMDEAKQNGLIKGYRNYFGFMVPEDVSYPKEDTNGWLSISAGYIISSANDMGKYLQLYLNGGKGVISPESIEAMFYDTVKEKGTSEYGLGWGTINDEKEPIFTHGGLVENYITHMFVLPESEVAGVILMNYNDYLVGNSMSATILQNVWKILLGEKPSYVNKMSYEMKHLIIDGIYLLVILVSVLPLIRYRSWKKQLNNIRKVRILIGFTILHVLYPTLLLFLPGILGTPFYVVGGFVPDLYLILIISAAVAYATGLIKAATILRHAINKKEKEEAHSPAA